MDWSISSECGFTILGSIGNKLTQLRRQACVIIEEKENPHINPLQLLHLYSDHET